MEWIDGSDGKEFEAGAETENQDLSGKVRLILTFLIWNFCEFWTIKCSNEYRFRKYAPRLWICLVRRYVKCWNNYSNGIYMVLSKFIFVLIKCIYVA